MKVTSGDFVVAYVTSRTLDDVAESTGLSKSAVMNRARYLKKIGVKLPKLEDQRGKTCLDVIELNNLVKKYANRKV